MPEETMQKLAAALALILAMPAAAQDAPRAMHPTRDVAVTYRVSNDAQSGEVMRMAWLAAARKQRIDPPGGLGWMLIDRGKPSATMVMDEERRMMELPVGMMGELTNDVPPGTRFRRLGTARIAGQGCTDWDVEAPEMRSTLCLTDDGVLLRGTTHKAGEGPSSIEATEVAYGAQDAARFAVPQGYRLTTLPGMAPPGR
jgi:hypothetical protein